MDVCIKNIPKEEWLIFKSESASHGMKSGEFFSKIVKEHKERCKESNWDKILYGEKKLKGILSQKDYEEIRKEFRENFKLRY